MCGRYTHLYTWRQIHDLLEGFLTSMHSALASAPDADHTPDPSYNVPPKATVPVVKLDDGALTPAAMQWWLVPHWSKSPDARYATFNARSEDAHTKPAFRSAFRRGRCLIPVSGFYEWQKLTTPGTPPKKAPHYITRADNQPLLFAGLCDTWGDPTIGPPLESCTILTTTPNAEMRSVHDRMPCILEPENAERWLDPDQTTDEARAFLRPAPDGLLTMHKVGSAVGRVTNNTPSLIEPID